MELEMREVEVDGGLRVTIAEQSQQIHTDVFTWLHTASVLR